jgi:hypothetical protein
MLTIKRLAFLVIFCIFAGLPYSKTTSAQSGWSDPYLLYQSNYLVVDPIAVTDVFGTVHVFWTESDVNDALIPAVFHTALIDSEWSTPVSILVSPAGGVISGFKVVADHNAKIHAIWQGANNSLYYSSVDCVTASDSISWTTPIVLGSSFTFPGITTDMEHGVFVVYPDESTASLYMITSSDGGNTWGVPRFISSSNLSDVGVNYTNVVVDADGTFYVAWSEFEIPAGWPPVGVFVSSSIDDGLTWRTPVQLAGEGSDQINLAVDQDGEAFAFWNGMIGVGGRYISKSIDRGQTWSEPLAVVPPGLGGTSGYPHVVFDSLKNGHMITTLDWQGGIQYLQQNGLSWSTGLGISSAIDYASYAISSLELPWLCITHGNLLHVVYEVGFKDIYYQQYTIDAPTIPTSAYATPPAENIETLTEKTPSSLVADITHTDVNQDGMVASSISQPINLAVFCVLGLILFVYLSKKWRQSR